LNGEQRGFRRTKNREGGAMGYEETEGEEGE